MRPSSGTYGLPESLRGRSADIRKCRQQWCDWAFPKGKYNSIPPTPNLDRWNDYGGYDVQADRLAHVDGCKLSLHLDSRRSLSFTESYARRAPLDLTPSAPRSPFHLISLRSRSCYDRSGSELGSGTHAMPCRFGPCVICASGASAVGAFILTTVGANANSRIQIRICHDTAFPGQS